MSAANKHDAAGQSTGLEIAIVGMAGRFPGADNVDAFWQNLRDGVESVRTYTDDELRARGVPDELIADPDYVKTAVTFEGVDQFDAAFFGYTPREAERLDPQHRIFLECAWEALESAGCDAAQWPGAIAVFGGAGANVYLLQHLLPGIRLGAHTGVADLLDLVGGNGAETLCTRVAYKLGLRGPAATVQTACSTSLMAVHMGCQSLIAGECDMALAGGVTLNLLQSSGYRYQPGAIFSPDGHCRAFDARAGGTMLGSGAGVVVLRRLEDALQDGDHIHAVIRATAANNDAADKIGFTAPSVNGQAAAIRAAHVLAGVSADSIGYVEAHGTGTALGDPIEVAALTQAFRASTDKKGFCAIGSVKTNIGHLDCAAGVAALIKTALALEQRTLPASLHFERPNPKIDFAGSPFFVNAQTRPWDGAGQVRRAGVSGFGIGGTNVHAVLEEAPELRRAAESGACGWQVLPVSAASAPALQQAVERLASHLEANPGQALADVAHTLQVGRRALPFRAAVAAADHAGTVQALRQPGLARSRPAPDTAPEVVFLFPGAGSQHARMGAALHAAYPVFRRTMDHCLDFARSELALDLRPYIWPEGDEAEVNTRLAQVENSQPAIFVVSYAMARLWESLGVRPSLMLGHSLGEYVAACLAGVFSLEDALRVVVARARLQSRMGAGAMTSVLLPAAQLQRLLGEGWDLAAVNGESLSVLAGPVPRIEQAEQILAGQGHVVRRLRTSVAFHSSMADSILGAFEDVVASVARHAPRIPFVSNVTGGLITAEQATDPAYWVKHLRGTVRFLDGLDTLLAVPGRVMLEVGPGDVLAGLARQHAQADQVAGIVASQTHGRQHEQNAQQWARAIGSLWSAGVAVDWAGGAGGAARRRVPLPAYPFQRRKFWVEPGPAAGDAWAQVGRGRGIAESLYAPSWRRCMARMAPVPDAGDSRCVLVVGGAGGFAERLSVALKASGRRVAVAGAGDAFRKVVPGRYLVPKADQEELQRLLHDVETELGPIGTVLHLWGLDVDGGPPVTDAEELERGFFSVLALARAMGMVCGACGDRTLVLSVITNQIDDVIGDEALRPIKATVRGLTKVIGQEYPQIAARVVDIQLPQAGSDAEAALCGQLIEELAGAEGEPLVAYRHGQRWIKTYEVLPTGGTSQPRLREHGVYLITGGLGGVGLALARHLALHWKAKLVLIGRSSLPERAFWESLAADDTQPRALRDRLAQLLSLERMGASVLADQADVADAGRLREVVLAARRRFGAIHGVIHAAGAPGGGMLSSLSRASVESVFAPKVAGTEALLAAVGDEPLDFVVLCSSISSIAGGMGMGDYAAANAYLDAVAVAMRREARFPVFSVGWDAWRELGMAAGMDIPDGVGWGAEVGAKAFEHIVCGPELPHLVVCTTDLAARLRPLDDSLLEALGASVAGASGAAQPRPELAMPFAEPSTDLERQLAAIWGDRLGIAPIGVHDNLYELGGNSLLAIQILSKVRADLKHSVQPSEFFHHLTVAGLASLIEKRSSEVQTGAEQFVLVPVPRSQVLRPAPIQRRVWVFDRLAAGNPQARAAYNETVVFALAGELDQAVLRSAIDQIIARHEVLRTAYPEDDDGEAVTVISPEIELPMEVADLSHLPEDAAMAEFTRIRARTAGQPFDLARGPLLRTALVRLAERRYLLVMTVHHIVFDGWSTAVFTNEFCEIYRALRECGTPTLPPLPIQYADYAAWHDQVLRGGAGDGSKAFWRSYLEGAPLVSVFPADHARPKVSSHAGDVLRIDFGQALSAQLSRRAREWEVSVFTLLLSAFLLVLHRRTGAADVVVGTDVAGRDHAALEPLLGFFINVLPIRSRLAAQGRGLRQWAREVHANVARVFDHQSVPLDQIMTAARIPRGQGSNPLLQMLFVMQNMPKQRFDIEGLAISVLPSGAVSSKFDQAVFVHDLEDGFAVDWVFSTELYERASVSGVADAWQTVLRTICTAPDSPTDSLPISADPGGASMTSSTVTKPMPVKSSKFDMLHSLKRQRSAETKLEQIRISFPSAGRQFPVLIEAIDRDLDPVWWASQQRAFIEDKLGTHAGIVFRNFGLKTPQDFERFTEAMEPKLYGSYGDLPKKEGGVNTYRSTPYPEKQMILYHNECAHTDRWPRKQWFFCELPSKVGGITPIVDCRELLAHLPAQIVEEMERKGLLYVRNFHPKLDVSWQHFFKTDDRTEVEERLRRGGIEWAWLDGDILQTRTRGPAVIAHPVTGARAFFNQVQLHHVSCLEPEVREDLLGLVGPELMPRHVFFGDGSPIPDETMNAIGMGYEACAVRLDWLRGDVVMLDNMLAAHARDPYEEPRKIVVAMGSMYERDTNGQIRPVAA